MKCKYLKELTFCPHSNPELCNTKCKDYFRKKVELQQKRILELEGQLEDVNYHKDRLEDLQEEFEKLEEDLEISEDTIIDLENEFQASQCEYEEAMADVDYYRDKVDELEAELEKLQDLKNNSEM